MSVRSAIHDERGFDHGQTGTDVDALDPATREAMRETFRRREAARSRREANSSRMGALHRVLEGAVSHWFALLTGLLLVWVALPWLAPVFMELGWRAPAEAIYILYSFQCHQLPQRSFFLFGPQSMYSLEHFHAAWQNTVDPLVLRQFIGNPDLGYKVAWSDRMVSAYSSIPLGALVWRLLGERPRQLPFWGFALLAIPMAIDGGTHLLSDLAGVDQGFRYANAWLADLTGHTFPASFYAGNMLGSFNSWLRLITGTLFGVGLAAFCFPYLKDAIVGRTATTG